MVPPEATAMLAEITHIQVPGGGRWVIGFLGLFHTAVGSLAIGFAFVVTILQIIGYRRRDMSYDLLAKRVQLWHVCIYNIGTINAIGLVFALSGLYPQFWSQIFTHFFWTIIVEEFLFFLLATTLTFHFFFWERMWGHKRLHIFLGALLTPLFFLQFYIINGMGAFMVTPGMGSSSVSQWGGTAFITGWDFKAFYNPSFLMLTLHRTLANFAYGAFVVACVCGFHLYFTKRRRLLDYYETGGRVAFYAAFTCFLSLPIVGYFYAHALMRDPHGHAAYVNLMWGKGDIVMGGIDWWWVKHAIVASMLGLGLAYYRRLGKLKSEFALPGVLVYSTAIFYLTFYVVMGAVMTWFFFWIMLLAGVLAAALAVHLLNRHKNSARAVFAMMGILSAATVLLGGYAREAARPRFVSADGTRTQDANGLDENRYSGYDDIYRAPERQRQPGPMRMVVTRPAYVEAMPARPGEIAPESRPSTAGITLPAGEVLMGMHCTSCHTLDRVHRHRGGDWKVIVERMRAYGMKMNHQETKAIIDYLEAKGPS